MTVEFLASLVRQLQGTLGGLAGLTISVGVGTATWTAARVSAEETVTHDLAGPDGTARTPLYVFVCGSTDQGAKVVAYHAFSYTATTFKTRGDFTDGTAPTGDSDFVWIAVG
jgi:hypothetical protein